MVLANSRYTLYKFKSCTSRASKQNNSILEKGVLFLAGYSLQTEKKQLSPLFLIVVFKLFTVFVILSNNYSRKNNEKKYNPAKKYLFSKLGKTKFFHKDLLSLCSTS